MNKKADLMWDQIGWWIFIIVAMIVIIAGLVYYAFPALNVSKLPW